MQFLKSHGAFILLAFVPAAAVLHFILLDRQTLVFVASAIAILPLTAYIGRATEALAERLGSGIGGLLNATFGNVTELIIGALALRRGLTGIVKASLTGSIIGNVLLVFGAAALIGGLKRPVLRFNRTAASTGATMLLLSAVGLIVPAMFHWLSRGSTASSQLKMDTAICGVLIVSYGLSLVFTLKTHRQSYGSAAHTTEEGGGHREGMWRPTLVLFASTATVGYMSELLVDTVMATASSLGLSQLFVGVIVVALIGNAAEHYSAVSLAVQDKMDATLSIAVGSSTQIALFVAPVLVFLSYLIAPHPMDLRFTGFEVAAVGLAVATIAFIAHDGETHWMEGVQLLAVYVILALGFYFLPTEAMPGY
jgi:Ca2+:H+ antiporter